MAYQIPRRTYYAMIWPAGRRRKQTRNFSRRRKPISISGGASEVGGYMTNFETVDGTTRTWSTRAHCLLRKTPGWSSNSLTARIDEVTERRLTLSLIRSRHPYAYISNSIRKHLLTGSYRPSISKTLTSRERAFSITDYICLDACVHADDSRV